MGLTEAIQIAANLGVIAGIVVLAYELRQNHRQLSQTNEQMTAQSRFNYYQNRISEYRYTAENVEVLELILKQAHGDELSLLEKFRVQARLSGVISGWEYEFGEYRMGRISEEEFNIHAKRQVYRAIDVGLAWQQYKNTAPSAFADFMEQNIVNSE